MKSGMYALMCAIISALIALPAAAYAQSSFTLYGLLQSAVDIDHFSGTTSVSSKNAVYLTSEDTFVGMIGTEDLGNNTYAKFKLETWTSLATGQSQVPGTLFGTESYVALSNSNWGTVQLGRQYTPSLWLSYAADPYGRANNGAIYNLAQQEVPGNFVRGFIPTQNNAIQFISPTVLGGVSARLMYAPGGNAGAPDNVGNMTSASIQFQGAQFFIGASYETERVAGSAVNSTLATISNTTYSVGATYEFDVAKVYGYYLQNSTQTFNTARVYLLGLTVPIGVSEIKSSYSWRNVADTSSMSASIFSLGYFYSISKSTTLFASYAHVKNSAAAAFGLWPSDIDYINQGLPADGMSVTSVELGIKHLF
jgi:predicted porin